MPGYLLQRNQAVEQVKGAGMKAWKKETVHHRRRSAETAIFKHKIIFRDKSTSRLKETQKTEVNAKYKIPNKFTGTGIAKTYQN